MRYAERGWTNNGSQEEGQEESSQEESHQKEVVFILESLEWDRRGHEGPRRILPMSIVQLFPGRFYMFAIYDTINPVIERG